MAGSQRILLGVSVDGIFTPDVSLDFTSLATFEADAGKAVGIVNWYQDWGSFNHDPPSVAQLQALAARSAVAMVTWSPEDTPSPVAYPLTSIAAGDFDAQITAFASGLAAYGGPVLLRFAHEMNGNWYQWGNTGGNTAAQYVAAWQHVHDVFVAAGATNVRWVWCPNVLNGAAAAFEPYYPGDAYIDWVGLDGYNFGDSPHGGWRSFSTLFSASYAALGALTTKPLLIAEVGCAESGGDKTAWIADMLSAQIPASYPRLQALCWFNEDQPPYDWRIESSPAAQAAFLSGIAAPRYVAG